MDVPECDHVDSEKTEALRRYRRTRKHGSLIRVAEAGCALLFLGYVFADVDMAGDFLHCMFRFLATPLSAFVFGNGIVLIIFLLPGDGRDHRKGSAALCFVCEEYESLRESTPGERRSSSCEEVEETLSTTAVEVDVNKKLQTELYTTTDTDSQRPKDEIGRPVGDSADDANDPIVPLEGAVRAIRKSKSVETTAGRPSSTGLRKWATDNARRMTVPIEGNDRDGSSLWPSVDGLSDEEFNLKVDMYITRKKLLLREEVMAERTRITMINEGLSSD